MSSSAHVQTIVFIAACVVFHVPFDGSFAVFIGFNLLFIVVNLALGFLISTARRTRCRRCSCRFSPSCRRSCSRASCSPFPGMPGWAQFIGEAVPATHFLRVIRAVMLKGASPGQIAGEVATLVLMLVIVSVLAISRYRVTLD